jgi:hypothetical protein
MGASRRSFKQSESEGNLRRSQLQVLQHGAAITRGSPVQRISYIEFRHIRALEQLAIPSMSRPRLLSCLQRVSAVLFPFHEKAPESRVKDTAPVGQLVEVEVRG